jgi:hypothetical protein
MTNLEQIVMKLAKVKKDLRLLRLESPIREALADLDDVSIMLDKAATESAKFDDESFTGILNRLATKLETLQLGPVKTIKFK